MDITEKTKKRKVVSKHVKCTAFTNSYGLWRVKGR